MDFQSILKNFLIEGELVSCEPYGNGHINETYLAVFTNNGERKRYILQKINSKLFNPVEKLMKNIELVTEFNRQKIKDRGGDPDRESLTIVKTVDGKTFYKQDEDNYFRVYIFIENTVAYQVVKNPKDFYYSAIAFGNFNNLLSEFDASLLHETIAKFHDTKKRYNDFLTALEKDEFDRAKECQEEIAFIKAREDYYGKIVDLLESGEMPLRVTHNDTKLNNVLLDDKTGKPVAVIDLDTIMPGLCGYDFGDGARSICCTTEEDETDLNLVKFDLDRFESFTKGYFKYLKKTVTPEEKATFALSVYVMTIELASRFLQDYLNGDTYFKITSKKHNLIRTRCQIALCKDIYSKLDKMKEIVKKYT